MKLTRPLMLATALTLALAGAAVAGVVAQTRGAVKTVKVTEKEFKITVTGKPTAGVDRFVIKNVGRYPHALSIAGPGMKTKRTPLIKPGTSAVLTVTLKSGAYTIWCPVPGHAAEGMKTSFRIGGAAAGGNTTTGEPTDTNSTTTDSGGGYGGGYG